MLLFSYCVLLNVIIINALLLTDEWNISSEKEAFMNVLSHIEFYISLCNSTELSYSWKKRQQ
jgi:hypothetical protein